MTENRAVSALSSLSISGPMQVEVRVGNTASLEIIGDSNLLALVHTESVNSGPTSKLLPRAAASSSDIQKIWIDERFDSNNPIRVIYTVPALHNVVSNGSGRLMVNGLNDGNISVQNSGSRTIQLQGKVSNLTIHSNGSGSINASALESKTAFVKIHGSGAVNLGQVRGDELNVSIHGSGSLNASGNVRNLMAHIYGSGSANLTGMTSETADLSSNGSGELTAAVSQNVIAQSNGSGHITVYGNPAQRNVNGKRVSFVN
ncbi:MAG: DUF2807 domain-containing protein [Pseudomonadota bacterium]